MFKRITFRFPKTKAYKTNKAGQFIDYVQDPPILDTLDEEFLIYQVMVDTDILSKVWEETKCSINESKTYHRTDMV